jgi:mannosyl-3-phosphoglycerate phosphatase
MRLIIFTDLDGSLLDHGDYAFDAARPSIERLKRAGIPLIITTSKTRREVESLQRDMGIRGPFIVENGGGIFLPRDDRNWKIDCGERQGDYMIVRLGTTYSTVRCFMERFGPDFGIRGFGDMTPEEIARWTELPLHKAVSAGEREFTEPFLLERPENLRPLAAAAEAAGLKLTRGGRFYHLIGAGQDKGLAVRIVRDIYRRNCAGPLTTVGLGDSENDRPMLEMVDIPVVIPRPDGSCLDIRRPGIIRAAAPGSRGWNDTVSALLNRCGMAKPRPCNSKGEGEER